VLPGFGNAMYNHQTHEGQVTTLIKQIGYEPGVTDIPWLLAVYRLTKLKNGFGNILNFVNTAEK